MRPGAPHGFQQMGRPVASTGQLPVCAFVLLRLDGDDLRRLPLSDRKAKLRKLLARARIQYVWHVEADGEESFEAACKLGLECIVSKKVSSALQVRLMQKLDQGVASLTCALTRVIFCSHRSQNFSMSDLQAAASRSSGKKTRSRSSGKKTRRQSCTLVQRHSSRSLRWLARWL